MSVVFEPRTPVKEVKPHRHVRLVGEIVRPPWSTDLSDDRVVLYKREGELIPGLRPQGKMVGKVYAVVSRSREERYHVALYDDGHAVCHCRAADSRRKCWHAELVRERRPPDR